MNYDIKEAVINQKRENKFSHAYLVETNNIEQFDETLNEVIKTFLCEDNASYCDNCQNCQFVNEYTHPNVMYINPDGTQIKVDQINELKTKFSLKSSFGRYNIYVIKEAEKLNTSSSNALLKFLEEPEENIIGILITTNKSLLLPTIVSRCQNYIAAFNKNNYTNDVINLASQIEGFSKKSHTIFEYQDLLKQADDKNLIKSAFAYLLDEETKKHINIEKIKILQDIVNKIRYNVNIDLVLLDYLLRVSEINE